MRRIVSFLLLGLLLYNMLGYAIVCLTEQPVAVAGSSDYIERSTYSRDIVIKVPVQLPYQSDWHAPEPAEGRIQHEGEFYRMVSRQLISDTMYVHCAFDQTARDRFLDLVSKVNEQLETGRQQRSSPSTVLKTFLKEYMISKRTHVFYIFSLPLSSAEPHFTVHTQPEAVRLVSSPPPDGVC